MHLPGLLLPIDEGDLPESQLFKGGAELSFQPSPTNAATPQVGILLQLQRHRLVANDVADRYTATLVL